MINCTENRKKEMANSQIKPLMACYKYKRKTFKISRVECPVCIVLLVLCSAVEVMQHQSVIIAGIAEM